MEKIADRDGLTYSLGSRSCTAAGFRRGHDRVERKARPAPALWNEAKKGGE